FLEKELHMAGGWTWSQTQPPHGVTPGQTVSGFRLVSPRPPTVVRCYAAGKTPSMTAREEPPDELFGAIHSVSWRFPSGYTIGPTPIGDEATPLAEASQLVALFDEAERQGWLASAATARRVRTALGSIRSAITAGNFTDASTRISTVLRDTSQLGLSSEAIAL